MEATKDPLHPEVPVREVQVRGRVWYSVPYLGYVNNLITGRQRQQVLVATITFLVLYSAYMFASAGRDHLRKRRNETTPDNNETSLDEEARLG